MNDETTGLASDGMKRRAVPLAVTIVLTFFALPIVGVILYGGGAAALGGLAIIAMLVAVQYPLMRFLVGRKK